MKAFPYMQQRPDGVVVDCNYGMDLRDYFAAHALQGILACNYTVNESPTVLAYKYADEMMKAREQ